MVGKGNLAVFESNNISETKEATPTKIGVHAWTSIPTCMNFLSQFQLIKFFNDHGLGKGNLAIFESSKAPKSEKPHPPKLLCMHVTSTSTSMIFLS